MVLNSIGYCLHLCINILFSFASVSSNNYLDEFHDMFQNIFFLPFLTCILPSHHYKVNGFVFHCNSIFYKFLNIFICPIYICVYIYICVCVCVYVCIYIYIYIYIYTFLGNYVYIYFKYFWILLQRNKEIYYSYLFSLILLLALSPSFDRFPFLVNISFFSI